MTVILQCDVMNADKASVSGKNTFKEVFKFYKNRKTPLDLSNMFNFENFDGVPEETVDLNFITKKEIGIDWKTTYGVGHPREWFVFTFHTKPGLFYIRNPFNTLTQRYWITRFLKDLTKKPNHLNIDSQNILGEDDDWWEYSQREENKDDPNSVLKKLRWATFGYHYNWDTKEYSEEASEFPGDLKSFCKDVGKVLGFPEFEPQAGIMNMYHKKSSLRGHTDHSELNLAAPLFSFSFGQAALFLIGGKTLNELPLRLIVQSGDIIIMSKESRLYYHGVPRLVEFLNDAWKKKTVGNEEVLNSDILDKERLQEVGNDEFWKPFELYANHSRVNVSLRQVY